MSTLTSQHEDFLNKIDALEKKVENIKKGIRIKSSNEALLQEIADKMSLLGDEETKVEQLFHNNMAAFETYYPDIYEFFSNFQPQRYMVDIHDGFLNIVDTKAQQHLYPYPAYLMATKQVLDFQESPQATRSMFFLNEKNDANFYHSVQLNKVIQVLLEREKQNKQSTGVKSLPKDINSLMVFGIGLGFHLDLLIGQHHIANLYLIEPDLDIFYTSLFTANWQEILPKLSEQQCSLHISLGPQEEDFFEDIQQQTYVNGRYEVSKTFGYVHYNTPEINSLVKQYSTRFHEMIRGWGFFDDSIISIAHLLGNLRLDVPLLKRSSLVKNEFADKPVCIVGNGPSLDSLINELKKVKDQVIIVSCGSALSALYQYGVIPDFHCEQERNSPVADKLDFYCPEEVLADIPFFGPSTLFPKVFTKFNHHFMSLKTEEPSTALMKEHVDVNDEIALQRYINPTVANTALSIMVSLGFKKFYFCGVDLGHKAGEAHHSKKSFYYDDEDESDLSLYTPANNSDKLDVEGNFGGDFICDGFFYTSRKLLERLISLQQQIECFNLSDGAKIEGAQPLKVEKLGEHINGTITDKKQKILSLIEQATLSNQGKEFADTIEEHLDFTGFSKLCNILIDALDVNVTSIKDGLEILQRQTRIIRDEQLCPSDNFYFLLNGSMLHMQATLMRLLYEADDEKDAINDFLQGLQHYREFLQQAPMIYKEKSLNLNEFDSTWIKNLKATQEAKVS